MDTFVLEDVCNNILNSEDLDSYTTPPLISTERSAVHEHCKKVGLISKTLHIHGIPEKKIEITKREKNKEQQKEFLVTREMVDFFSRFSGVPIPTTNPDYVQYYLTELKNYYNCQLWNGFIEDVKKYGFGKMKLDSLYVRAKIIEYIKENKEFVEFCKIDYDLPKDFRTKNSVYKQNNANKYFLSIDIKSANYTNLQKNCPSINKSWKELVMTYTNSEFLAESKYLREIVFGELGNKKLLATILLLIKSFDDMVQLNENLKSNLKKVVISTDEIIYEISNTFDVTQLTYILDSLDKERKIYRVEKFKLIQLKPYSYFVKEIDGGKVQFKSINKMWIMQCVKHYQGKELTLYDKKFTYEDFESTFDDLLMFDE